MRQPTRGELLPSGFKDTLLILDIGYLNPQTILTKIIEHIPIALQHAVQ